MNHKKQFFGTTYHDDHWGTSGKPVLHFFHANSYCSGMYLPFLKPLLSDYEIFALEIPGHGRSNWDGLIQSWEDLADYFIQYLDSLDCAKPVVGMGHSIGGVVSMIAAVRRPDLFSKLVLLDPVLLPARILAIIRFANLVGYRYKTPLISGATRRRRHFPSREAARQHYAGKRTFKHWQPEVFDAYVACGFRNARDGGVELSCSPELEISIYRSIPTNVWQYVRKIQTPTLILGGDRTDTLLPQAIKRLEKFQHRIKTRVVPGSHLFPFEYPNEAMVAIKEFLE